MNTFMPLSKLNTEIKQIGSASSNIVGQLSNAIGSILYHAMKDGQSTPATSLVNLLNRKHRATVVEYLCEFGPFSYNRKDGFRYAKGKARVYEHASGSPEREAWVVSYINDLESYATWEGQSEKVPTFNDVDVEKVLKGYIKHLFERIHNAKDNGKSVKMPTDPLLAKIVEEMGAANV